MSLVRPLLEQVLYFLFLDFCCGLNQNRPSIRASASNRENTVHLFESIDLWNFGVNYISQQSAKTQAQLSYQRYNLITYFCPKITILIISVHQQTYFSPFFPLLLLCKFCCKIQNFFKNPKMPQKMQCKSKIFLFERTT